MRLLKTPFAQRDLGSYQVAKSELITQYILMLRIEINNFNPHIVEQLKQSLLWENYIQTDVLEPTVVVPVEKTTSTQK